MDNGISYSDINEYQHLFTLAPSFLLERMAKKNSNLVKKFKSPVQSYLSTLNDVQRNKLDIILASDIDVLQSLMDEAFLKTKIKQFKILANSDYKQFIEINLQELKKMV